MRSYLKFVVVLVLCLGLIRFYNVYKVQASPVLPGVMIGTQDFRQVETTRELTQRLRTQMEQPILVSFNRQREILAPETVGFQLDMDRILAETATYLEGDAFLRATLRRLLGLPEEQHHVPIYYNVDREKTVAWLQDLNQQYRTDPQPYQLLPVAQDWLAAQGGPELPELGFMAQPYPDWTWQAGAPGVSVNVEASVSSMPLAFMHPGNRTWHLETVEARETTPALSLLAAALDDFTANFPGFASFYLQDLTTGEAVEFDSHVAFSGMSTLKLVIVMAVMRDIDGIVADPDLGQWIDLALGDSNNAAANILLYALGDGDTRRGAAVVTEFARQLGLENTYMQSGYDDKIQLPPLPTSANTQTEWDTAPDPNLQTTAADMGRTLAAIYECTLGRGLFIEIFPGEIQPEECAAILFYLTHNEFQEMLWGGLPAPAQRDVVHKHGFTNQDHSDVALIWGPAGPYVLSLYLYRPVWMDWQTSNSTMYNVSRIAWRFYEQIAASTDRTFVPSPDFMPPAGYVPQPGTN